MTETPVGEWAEDENGHSQEFSDWANQSGERLRAARRDAAKTPPSVEDLQEQVREARAWAWSLHHRYYNPDVTDRHNPPEWLESDELPDAWVEAEARRTTDRV